MLRTSVSPNIFSGGYRVNVIPSEATATLDVRMLPDEDPAKFLELVKQVVNDPQRSKSASGARDAAGDAAASSTPTRSRRSKANVTKHYKAITLPTMSTGATDMAYLRAQGDAVLRHRPATDIEDGPKGFGAHSDQERILESELYPIRALQLGRGRRSRSRKVSCVIRSIPRRKGDVVDVYGIGQIADPYRWLEDLDSPEVAAWVAAQNAVTFAISKRCRCATTSSSASPSSGTTRGCLPVDRERPPVLQRTAGCSASRRSTCAPASSIRRRWSSIPTCLSADGTVSLAQFAPSPDAKLIAYAICRRRRRLDDAHVRDVATGKDLADEVTWMRFSDISWTNDSKGFFYSRYPEPPKGKVLEAALSGQAIYYHRVGTPQSEDA